MLIFLVGFMGCGKSFTGKHLSAVFELPFVDMDAIIEKQEGRSISEIFKVDGEPYFRELERKFILSLNHEQATVVATGGGAPCYLDNMDILNKKGITIFLDVDREVIVERLLNGGDKRPLLKGMDHLDLGFFYDRKMGERRPFYEKANFRLKHQDIEVISDLLRAFLA